MNSYSLLVKQIIQILNHSITKQENLSIILFSDACQHLGITQMAVEHPLYKNNLTSFFKMKLSKNTKVL